MDTSSIAGSDARLEINLIDGDLNLGNNSASAFGTTIFDTDQILQDFVATNTLSFSIAFSNAFAGGDSDLLIINLLDPFSNFTLVDTDLDALNAPVPYQDAILVCELKSASCLSPSTSNPVISVSVSVPEPSTLGLLTLIPGVMVLRQRRAKRATRA